MQTPAMLPSREMQIREIQPRDLVPVLRLTQSVPEAPAWAIQDFRKLLNSDGCAGGSSLSRMAWVVESASQVMGLVVVQRLLITGEAPSTAECELESILVDPGARRLGLGRQLLSQAIAWCRQQRAAVLRLEVRASNHGAIRLYEASGFTRTGERPRYYSDPEEDALLMTLAFHSPCEAKRPVVSALN